MYINEEGRKFKFIHDKKLQMRFPKFVCDQNKFAISL